MKDGSFLSPPLDATSWVFILFCYRQNISFVPVHIPGKLNVVADQGPSSTEWMLDPWSFESFCQEFPIFPTVVLFCLRATSRLSYSVFSRAGSTGLFRMPWIPFFGLNKFFPSFYAFPPPGLLPFPFKGIVRFRGAMPLLVPLTLNNIWILILAFSRRITFYWYSDYSLCEIIAPVEWSLLDSIFKTYAPLVLGVRGPSSSVCLSFEVPVLNPAGSSRVSPVRSDLSFEGFSSRRDPGIPRSRWGILFLFLKVSFYSGLCWSISRTSSCFLVSHFS